MQYIDTALYLLQRRRLKSTFSFCFSCSTLSFEGPSERRTYLIRSESFCKIWQLVPCNVHSVNSLMRDRFNLFIFVIEEELILLLFLRLLYLYASCLNICRRVVWHVKNISKQKVHTKLGNSKWTSLKEKNFPALKEFWLLFFSNV